jgi:O-antigen/teichoic acid export membrane protein
VLFAAYAFFMHRNISSIRFSFSAGKAKYLLLTGIPFGVYCLFNTLNVYLDKNLLSILDFKDIANYTQPYNLVMALSFIPLAFIASVFPLFSKLAITNNGSMKYACEKSFKYLITIMLPICVGTSLLADRIVFTMWGSTFSGAIPVLRILIWGLFFMTINAIGSTLVNATHKERANMVNIIFYTAVNAVLNIALIPVFGAVGSSVTFLITTGILNMAVTSYIARDSLKGINFVGPLVRSGVASVAMTAFILLVNVNNLFMYVILGAAVYFVAFALVGGVSRDDIELIERILFHKPNNPEDVKIEIL